MLTLPACLRNSLKRGLQISQDLKILRPTTEFQGQSWLQDPTPSPQPCSHRSCSTSTPESTPSTPDDTVRTAQADLLKVLLHPISKGHVYNGYLAPFMVNVQGRYFLDPTQTLQSTMRALHVIKNVLRDDGHVYIVNSNPLMKPLMAEAARSCVNPNVWFYSDKWVPGTLTNVKHTKRLLLPDHQPNRRLFAKKGVKMVNFHKSPSSHTDAPAALPWQDRWRLYDLGQAVGASRELLQELMTLEASTGRTPLPGSAHDKHACIRLFVVLDTTINSQALVEAYQKNIMSIALVNHHKDLSNITYPVFARDNHPQFQHFFLNWIIRIVNSPPA